MQNLIKNAQWFSYENGKILYFTNTGPITYDKFCLDQHRFCSLTMHHGTAINAYDVSVALHDTAIVRFGYHMRAIILDHAEVHISFYDDNDHLLSACAKDIAYLVDEDFHDVCAAFRVPVHACYMKLALHFHGDVTACTFGMPFLECYKSTEQDMEF